MIPAGFDYHAPTTLADALALMGRLGPDAKLLASGHSLLPMMKLRFAQPAHLVDLGRATLPLWLDGRLPAATWLAAVALAAAWSRARADEPWRPGLALATTGGFAIVGFYQGATTGSGVATLAAAAAGGALLFVAWHVACALGAAQLPRRVEVLAAVAGAAAAWIVAQVGGDPSSPRGVVCAIGALGCAVAGLALLAPRGARRNQRGGLVGCALAPGATGLGDDPARWPALGARWAMLPLMAMSASAADLCGAGAGASGALHLAAMLAPALVAPRRGGALTAAALMIASPMALVAWPGAEGIVALTLLQAAAWSLAWSQELPCAALPQGALALAAPPLAVLALGALGERSGAVGLVAVHLGLAALSALGVLAWALHGAPALREELS